MKSTSAVIGFLSLVISLNRDLAFAENAVAVEVVSPPKPPIGQLSVEEMLKPQKNASELFSRLDIDGSFLKNATVAPIQRTEAVEGDATFAWNSQSFCWQSPAFCHYPLYFEQPNFERYGIRSSSILAPPLSAAHFFSSTVLLPVKAIRRPPWCSSCTLGNVRPGDWSPIQHSPYLH